MKTDQLCIETQPGLNRDSTDPQPPPPDAARFDKTLDAWVLSRYADVLRALREPGLCQVGPRSRYRSGTCDKNAQSRRRAKVRAALPYWRLAEWQPQMQFLAHNMMDELPRGRSIDLLSEFLWPWSLAVTLAIIDRVPFTADVWPISHTTYQAGRLTVRTRWFDHAPRGLSLN